MDRGSSNKGKPRGYPRLRASHGRLQVIFRHDGQEETLSLGLPDTVANRIAADAIRDALYSDLSRGRYLPGSKLDYLPDYARSLSGVNKNTEIKTYLDLWVNYVQNQGNNYSVTVQNAVFGSVKKFLTENPKIKLNQPGLLTEKLSQQYKHTTAIRLLGAIKVASKWSYKQGLINANYIVDAKITIPKQKEESGGNPFEQYEIDAIINGFEKWKGSEWVYVIKFLLSTGCRPSEAFALRFSDVNLRRKEITFSKRRLLASTKVHEIDGLKTQNKRVFPCNSDLINLLNEIKQSQNKTNDDYVLTVGDKPLDNTRLIRAWYGAKRNKQWETKGVVTKLVESGAVDEYREPYALRDTFITHALAQGVPIHTVAKWVGNSPATIDKHYAGALKGYTPPSLF